MENGYEDNFIQSRARIAIYDDLHSAPHIVDIEPLPTREYIEALASQTYRFSQDAGGSIPYTVIREVAENFIHASFREPVISILEKGNTISFADQGPGIAQKQKAQLPGFTSATAQMKEYIRGVGSGLPIAKEYMTLTGGCLVIDDNINNGTVVTIYSKTPREETSSNFQTYPSTIKQQPSMQQRISEREDKILDLALEQGAIGQTDIKNYLGISLATSTRALETLEKAGYLRTTASKKRVLTDDGYQYLRDRI